jgi:hypothetical protein
MELEMCLKAAGQIAAFTGYDGTTIRGLGGDGSLVPTNATPGARGVIKIYELF